MTVTLGGERLGSGNKQDLELHNYYRSTHDLSRKFASSVQCGTLYPFMVIPVMRGDTFEIDLNAAARTIPTKGPLFGSFKMQTDVFFAPVRLYQGILHNNPLAIGLKMNQVKFPIMNMYGKATQNDILNIREAGRISNSCLMKYLGLSGIGSLSYRAGAGQTRGFNAIPMLAYYDIFKNYYANKQEENAYVLGQKVTHQYPENVTTAVYQPDGESPQELSINDEQGYKFVDALVNINEEGQIVLACNSQEAATNILDTCKYYYRYTGDLGWTQTTGDGNIVTQVEQSTDQIVATVQNVGGEGFSATLHVRIFFKEKEEKDITNLDIIPFPLSNIDDMRMNLLSHHTLNQAYIIQSRSIESDKFEEELPYSQNTGYDTDNKSLSKQHLNGLMLKTYQADMFNAWVNTDWIDGENGIAELTKIAVTDGSVYIDSINLAEKLYNMLNRVAVSGGTYEDWQDAVYTDSPRRHIESPVYLGGMSSEIVFEEIIQTAPVGDKPLGTLGGRGTLVKRKGGNIDCKIDEAGFIIGIVSLTPRIFYTQGNEFYLTDLYSMDDLHKPALDGIGFQDLIGERLAWWDTHVAGDSVVYRSKIGKLPAWIEYMTAVDKAYGDFAEMDGDGFMILQRNYEPSTQNKIKDATTYIDPTKFNYAFAYDALDSQNFWIEIDSKVIARRLMSAKQIPNI